MMLLLDGLRFRDLHFPRGASLAAALAERNVGYILTPNLFSVSFFSSAMGAGSSFYGDVLPQPEVDTLLEKALEIGSNHWDTVGFSVFHL